MVNDRAPNPDDDGRSLNKELLERFTALARHISDFFGRLDGVEASQAEVFRSLLLYQLEQSGAGKTKKIEPFVAAPRNPSSTMRAGGPTLVKDNDAIPLHGKLRLNRGIQFVVLNALSNCEGPHSNGSLFDLVSGAKLIDRGTRGSFNTRLHRMKSPKHGVPLIGWDERCRAQQIFITEAGRTEIAKLKTYLRPEEIGMLKERAPQVFK